MADDMYAAIYARVSSEDQAKGYSLPTQVEECLALAKREGYTVPEGYIFQEDITGTILDGRPELRKVRELARSGAVAAVIVHDPDRLARKLGYQILLDEEAEKAGVKLLFVLHQREGSAEGTLFFHMRGALAEYERAKIMERIGRGMVGRAKAGYPSGGTVPFGYQRILEKHKGGWEIVEEEAAIVRRIFDMCLQGMTTRGIAKQLTEERVPTKKDRQPKGGNPKTAGVGEWGRAVVHRLLRYEGYMGKTTGTRRNGEITGQKGAKPALVRSGLRSPSRR